MLGPASVNGCFGMLEPEKVRILSSNDEANLKSNHKSTSENTPIKRFNSIENGTQIMKEESLGKRSPIGSSERFNSKENTPQIRSQKKLSGFQNSNGDISFRGSPLLD